MQTAHKRRLSDIFDFRLVSVLRHTSAERKTDLESEKAVVKAKVKTIVQMYVPDATCITLHWDVIETLDEIKIGFVHFSLFSQSCGVVQESMTLREIKRDIEDIGYEPFIKLFGYSMKFVF